MQEILTINNTKENVLEFDVSIQGLQTDDIRVWFSIRANGIEFGFACVKEDGDKWSCTIPPLDYIEKSAFPCMLKLVADGYYFEPMVGTVNIVGSHQIYATPSTADKVEAPTVVVQTEAKRSTPAKTAILEAHKLDKVVQQIIKDTGKAKKNITVPTKSELMEQQSATKAAKSKPKLFSKKKKVVEKITTKAKSKKTVDDKKDKAVIAILEDLGVKKGNNKGKPSVTVIRKNIKTND